MLGRLLCGIFFLSGATALVFETVWFRQAGLTFGNSVWASSIVLASFMAGLALGNGLAARFGNRIAYPVRFYSLIEVVIGLTGAALVWILPGLTSGLMPLVSPILEEPWLLNLLRFTCGFVLMLLPATAMGATLPLLVRGMLSRDSNFGSVLGRLYGWNTLGGVCGAVIGEAVLLDWFGVRGTALAALGGALTAAAVARLVGRRFAPALMGATRPTPMTSRAWSYLVAAGLSGAILLALEVVWLRFLRLFFPSSTLVFSLVLAVVLAGIGLGGLLAGFWLRRNTESFRHASSVAFACGILSAAVYAGFRFALTEQDGVYLTVLWQAGWLVFPVSLLSGVLFTFTGTALNRELGAETRAAGLLTLSNTVGAGLGALLAGFVLLPWLGMERSLFVLGASYGIVAVLLLGTRASEGRPRSRVLGYAPALLFAASVGFFPFGSMNDDYLHHSLLRVNPDERLELVGMREGRTETIVYLRESLLGEPVSHRLVTDGFVMSGNAFEGRRYMKLFVYWAIALRPDPERALLISYGVGSTAKALTDTRSLKEIDVVDISRDVLEMNDIVFPDPADQPLRDPRVRVHIEDGRYFLQTTQQRYDLITGEPPPPKHAGVVNLYTREYFQLIYDRLTPGGINTYWLPVAGLFAPEAKAIIRGYCDVFKDCSLWLGWGESWMLVGSRDGLRPTSESEFARQWEDPVVGAELRALGFEFPEQIGAQFMGDVAFLDELTQGIEPLVDNFPKRLTDQPVRGGPDRATYMLWMDAEEARSRFAASAFIQRVWPAKLRERTLRYFELRVGDNLLRARQSDAWSHIKRVHTALTHTDLRVPALLELRTNDDQLAAIDRLAARGDLEALGHLYRGWGALADRDFARASESFERAYEGNANHRFLPQYRRYSRCMAAKGEQVNPARMDTPGELPDVAEPDAFCKRLERRLQN